MQSTRRRAQSGQSLVDAVVASGLLGICVVAGIVAIDTASAAAAQATQEAWGSCAVRTELRAVLAADWSGSGSYNTPANVEVKAVSDPAIANLQDVTATAYDARTRNVLATASVKKAMRLSGTASVDAAQVAAACQ